MATKSPLPPSIGSLWQPKQELESGPLVRVKAGLTPLLRRVGTIACVAFGPAGAVGGGELGLEENPAALDQRRERRRARGRDGVEIDVRGKDLLVPTAPTRARAAAAPASSASARQRLPGSQT